MSPTAVERIRKEQDAADLRALGVAVAPQPEFGLMSDDIGIDKMVLDIVKDGPKDIDVREAVTGGDVILTLDGASTVTLTLHDQERAILKSGLLSDEDGQLRTIDVQIDGLWFRLVKLNKNEDDLVLTFEDRIVAYLRSKKGPRKASRSKVTRAQFILSLSRSVRAQRIVFNCPDINVKKPIKKASEAESKERRDRDRKRGFASGTELKGAQTDRIPKAQLDNAERVLATAESHGAGEKATLALIEACLIEAPDFKNPASGDGTSVGILQLIDTHYGGSVSKRRDIERVVTDFLTKGFTGRGGAIELARENPNWSAGRIAQAVQGSAFPERYDTMRGRARAILDAWGGVGGKTVFDYKRYEFKVDRKETYWTAIQRLAREVRRRAFVVGGELFYMNEIDLINSRARFKFSERTDGINNIDFDWDRGKTTRRATVSCRINRWAAPPGTVVIIDELGPADGRWLVETITRPLFSAEAIITLKQPAKELLEPRPELANQSGGNVSGDVGTDDDAKGIVDQAFEIGHEAGGEGVFVVSDYRPGSTTSSGNPSDHSFNSSRQAARDIAVTGINAITGPPSAKLDKAVVAIGKAFGKDYGNGKRRIVDTFEWKGYRIQIIWRTPEYGGHMGHIHIGARRSSSPSAPGGFGRTP